MFKESMEKIKILIVDDEKDTLEAMQMGLQLQKKYNILTADSRNDAINKIKKESIDVIVTDLKLKDGSGLEIISFIHDNYPGIKIIMVTAYGTIDTAIKAMRGGAYDYLQKPIRINDLKQLINRVSENILLKRENEQLKKALRKDSDLPVLIGSSPKFLQVIELIKQVAPSQSTIIITGESGTGKEIIAETIEHFSTRHGRQFVKINCGAIPENLLESEMFGYEKGAFTGALNQKKGKLEIAHEGTLFLDEIGELPRPMQVKLLRVLQNGEFERLGGTITQKVNIRLIAATNANLENMVSEGTFREDLFYRLNVISVELPPLRERIEDIPGLAQFFISKYNQLNSKAVEAIDDKVIKAMNSHPWNGNIRELENMIERAVVLSNSNILSVKHFPALTIFPFQKVDIIIGNSLAEIEKETILRTLRFHQYDKNKTAMTLQIGLATLYRKIKEYNITEM